MKSKQLSVRDAQPADSQAWDDFVLQHPQATFFHLFAWQNVIAKAFGHDTHYLLVEGDGIVQGVLPLAHIRSRLFGNALISLPFCVYGGCVANSPVADTKLREAASSLAECLAVDYLELRHRDPRPTDWPGKDLYVTFRKTLAPGVEENFTAIPRKQRAMIRKGIDAGLVSVVDDNVDRLYAVYSESVRNLGTPIFAKKYLRVLKEAFGDRCEVLTILRDTRLVSSVMSFYFRDEVLPYYGGGTTEARACKANDFMYWELMRRACENGIRVFDYGRSKVGTGSYRFKKHWGFDEQPLNYEYFLVNVDRVPNVSPTNPRYRLFVNAWRHLPLPISRVLGPTLARNLG